MSSRHIDQALLQAWATGFSLSLSGIRAICSLACLSPGPFYEIWETNLQNGALGTLALTPHCPSFSTAPYFLLCFPHTLVPYTAVFQCPAPPLPHSGPLHCCVPVLSRCLPFPFHASTLDGSVLLKMASVIFLGSNKCQLVFLKIRMGCLLINDHTDNKTENPVGSQAGI